MSTREIADGHMAAGNKCARKGWFHKPDYQGAALEYDKAALAYKNLKEWGLATDAYKKVAECHRENGVLSAAARAYESAAGCCKDGLKDATQCGEFYRLAAEAYHNNNNDDRAADALSRGAKAIDGLALKESNESKQLELYGLAIQLVKDGINFYESNEKLAIYGLKAVKSAVTIALRARLAEEAIGLYEKMILICVGDPANNNGHYNDVHKAALSLIILHLAKGDDVSAGRVYDRECRRGAGGNERTAFFHSDFGKCATKLLDAWDSRDQDAVDAVAKCQDVTFLDSELVRIAKKLSVDGEGIKFVTLGKSSYVPINEEPASIALKGVPPPSATAGGDAGDSDDKGKGELSIGDKREVAKMEQNEKNRELLFGSSATSGGAGKKEKSKSDDYGLKLDNDVDDEVDNDDDDDDSDDSEFDRILAKQGITADDAVKIKDDDDDEDILPKVDDDDGYEFNDDELC